MLLLMDPFVAGNNQRERNVCHFLHGLPELFIFFHVLWSNYSDLTRPHPKWWFSKGNPLISGKSRLVTVKYYNLARCHVSPFFCWVKKKTIVLQPLWLVCIVMTQRKNVILKLLGKKLDYVKLCVKKQGQNIHVPRPNEKTRSHLEKTMGPGHKKKVTMVRRKKTTGPRT